MIIDKSKIVAKYINNKETLLKIITNSKPNKETNTGFWLFDECIKKDSVYSKINEGPWYIKYIVYLYENKPIALRSFSEDYYTKYESDKKLKEQFKNYVRLFDFQVDSKYKGNRIQQYAWNHLKEIEQKKGFEGFTLMCYEESLQQKYKNDGFHGNQRFMWKSFNESYNIMRNKKALYESIMLAIAKEVKKALNEDNTQIETTFIDIEINFVNKLLEFIMAYYNALKHLDETDPKWKENFNDKKITKTIFVSLQNLYNDTCEYAKIIKKYCKDNNKNINNYKFLNNVNEGIQVNNLDTYENVKYQLSNIVKLINIIKKLYDDHKYEEIINTKLLEKIINVYYEEYKTIYNVFYKFCDDIQQSKLLSIHH